MNTSLFTLTASGFILLTLACMAFVLYGLHFALKASGMELGKRRRIFYTALGGIVFWITIISILSVNGFFQDFSAMPPRLIFMLLPPLLVILRLTFSKGLGDLLRHIPQSWLIYMQSFRFFVEILLWMLLIQNVIPVQMSLEGYNMDIVAGITAPLFAYLYVRQKWSYKAAVAWNIFGLSLLLNIVVISILSAPLPIRYFMNEPANTVVTLFPYILLPTVLVPMAYMLHFFSLKQLLSAQKENRKRSLVPAGL